MMTDALLGNFGLFQPKVVRHAAGADDLNLSVLIRQHVQALVFLRKKLGYAKKDLLKAKLHKERLYELEKERKSGLYGLAQQFMVGSYQDGTYQLAQDSDQLDVINTELFKAMNAHIKAWEKYDEILQDIDKYTIAKQNLVDERIRGLCTPLSVYEGRMEQEEKLYEPPALR
jgi:hypothetical protein